MGEFRSQQNAMRHITSSSSITRTPLSSSGRPSAAPAGSARRSAASDALLRLHRPGRHPVRSAPPRAAHLQRSGRSRAAAPHPPRARRHRLVSPSPRPPSRPFPRARRGSRSLTWLASSGSGDAGLSSSSRSSVITRWAPPRVESRTSTRCSSATSRATTISIASVSPVTQSAEITSASRAPPGRSAGARCRRGARARPRRRPAARSRRPRSPAGRRSARTMPGLLEAADAVQRGGGGEADEPRELDVGAGRVGLQLLEQLQVNGIERNGHIDEIIFGHEREPSNHHWRMRPNRPIMRRCHDHEPHRHPRPRRRRRAVGPHRAAVEALARLARRRLADRVRFALAAPLLAYAGRRGLRAALTPRVAAAGAIGFGAVILLQNAGIERTSVSHAALRGRRRAGDGGADGRRARPGRRAARSPGPATAWRWPASRWWRAAAAPARRPRRPARVRVGGAVGDVHRGPAAAARRARPGGGHRRTVRRGRARRAAARARLRGRAARAGTAGRWSRSARWRSPARCCRSGCSPTARRTSRPSLAGSFLNLEPLVGVAVGWIGFGEAVAATQLLGGVAVLAGIALSTSTLARRGRRPHSGRPRGLAAATADRHELAP